MGWPFVTLLTEAVLDLWYKINGVMSRRTLIVLIFCKPEDCAALGSRVLRLESFIGGNGRSSERSCDLYPESCHRQAEPRCEFLVFFLVRDAVFDDGGR
jgi:hypothetical protein